MSEIEKSKRRAIRRHHRGRMIRRARRVMPAYLRDWAIRKHDHLKSCSCYLCGNVRKWNGPTVKERRHARQNPTDVAAFEDEPEDDT